LAPVLAFHALEQLLIAVFVVAAPFIMNSLRIIYS